MQKVNIVFSILLAVCGLLRVQVALGDLIDADCLEEFDADSRFSIERMLPRVLQCFRTKSSTYISLRSENIGFVDVKAMEDGDLDSLHSLLFELRELTGAFEQLELQFVSIGGNNPGQSLFFRQQINGVPVYARNRVSFSADGHVSELSSLVIDPNLVLSSPPILRDEAVALAIEAVEIKIGSRFEKSTVSDNPLFQTRLYYSASAKDDTHGLFWLTSVEGRARGYSYAFSVRVDATTGQTVIANMVED